MEGKGEGLLFTIECQLLTGKYGVEFFRIFRTNETI